MVECGYLLVVGSPLYMKHYAKLKQLHLLYLSLLFEY